MGRLTHDSWGIKLQDVRDIQGYKNLIYPKLPKRTLDDHREADFKTSVQEVREILVEVKCKGLVMWM